MKKYLLSTLAGAILMLVPVGVWGDNPVPKAPKPVAPSAQQQQAFTERFWQAVESGDPKAVDNLTKEVAGQTDGVQAQMEGQMLANLMNGKSATGGDPVGFRGDPNDPGPMDWSDWNIETDANGNVTGFKEKDFEAKDKDGDGKISDAERKEWDKKKAEENAEAEEAKKHPDWDQDGDKLPDPGFALDCWRCKKPPSVDPGCMDGQSGPCPGTCSTEYQCHEHTEGPRTCHSCVPKETAAPFCEACGQSSDPACDGKCPSVACAPIDLDLKSCKIVPTMQTRERGSTQKCYGCINITQIEVTWVVIIIETPCQRFVLDKGKEGEFKPSSIMALSKVDQESGKIKNASGQLKSTSDFLGSFGAGFGPGGITSPGKIGMGQLSSALGAGLSKGGSFGDGCFDEALKTADADAASQGMPTSEEIKEPNKSKKKDKGKEDSGAISKEDIKKAEDAGSPAVSGPIVACGEEGKNKVLKIYDASGALVDTITQAMLKANPNIITEKLGAAQVLADAFIQKSGFDFAGYVQKFTGLPLKDMQAVAAQVAQVKAQVDQVAGKAKKKKKGKEEEIILPNDPLYKVPDAKKKKLKRKAEAGDIVIGSGMTMFGQVQGASASSEKKENVDIVDQYAIQVVGYTPVTDPNSAWNVVDATQQNVVVAVVDSGLDMTHPDGPQYIWTNPKETPGNGIDDDGDGFIDDIHGWNFVNENHDFTDVRGHGTFVAGIIAAKQNNGIGIAGINPGAVIMPIKVTDDEGQTDNLAIYRGINYAVNHGAKIINVSLGGRSISKLEQEAIERAHAMGALVVLAAGNSNENMMLFGPSSSKYGLAVGEINFDGERSTASNWGPNLGLVAPGERVYSLCSKDTKDVLPSIRKSGYYQLDGTSFTSPMVAATASLIWAKNPSLTNQQVADLILATATDMGEKGWDGMTGAGVLNAAAALRADAHGQNVVMMTNIRLNRDVRDKVVSVDVFGSVRGKIKEFTLEAGKGKRPGKFNVIAGPFKDKLDYQFIARIIVQESLRGSDDWVLMIRAVDDSGQEHIASTPFTLPK